METCSLPASSRKCQGCWLVTTHCACKELREISSSISLQHDVILFLHYREWVKRLASNTARLLPMCVDADVYIFGDLVSECRMHERINEARRRRRDLLILFPSNDAQTCTEFFSSRQSLQEPGLGACTLIIIDGSWKNARTMNSALPRWIPRVKLSTSSRAKFTNMR